MSYTLDDTAMPFANGTNEIALAPRLLVLVARNARKLPSASRASSASDTRSRPWKSVRKASRRSQAHLTGRPRRFAAQATSNKLGAGVVADAEIAADIAGDHAHRVF